MRAKILLAVTVALTMAACDKDGDGTFTPQDQFLDPTSPGNVLHNLAACHNKRDYDHVLPIIRDDLQFILVDKDRTQIPGELFANGVWDAPGLLQAMYRMLDRSYVPCDSLAAIRHMEMSLELLGTPTPTNLQGAPEGTLEGRADLDFIVETIGRIAYRARSQPYFFFVPDSSAAEKEGVTWKLWRVIDMPNMYSPGYALPDCAAGSRTGAPAHGAGSKVFVGRDSEEVPVPVQHATWGVILAFFSTPCG
jgi:hypothetical protein